MLVIVQRYVDPKLKVAELTLNILRSFIHAHLIDIGCASMNDPKRFKLGEDQKFFVKKISIFTT